jgi:GTP cyclohydrolase I
MQIVQELQNALGTKDVACVTRNICVNSRGISDIESSTVTSESVENLKTLKLRVSGLY